MEHVDTIAVLIGVAIAGVTLWYQNKRNSEQRRLEHEDLGHWRGRVDARLESTEKWRSDHEVHCNERTKGLHAKIDHGFELLNQSIIELSKSKAG